MPGCTLDWFLASYGLHYLVRYTVFQLRSSYDTAFIHRGSATIDNCSTQIVGNAHNQISNRFVAHGLNHHRDDASRFICVR